MVGTLTSKLPFLIYVHNLQDGWRIATNFELRFVPITCRLVRPSAGTGNWWQTHRHWWCVGWWWSLTERECNESFWRIENGVKSASWTWCHGLGFSYSLFFLQGSLTNSSPHDWHLECVKMFTSRLAIPILWPCCTQCLRPDILHNRLFLCRQGQKPSWQSLPGASPPCTWSSSPSWTPSRMPDIWQLLASMILVPHVSWSFMQPVRESTTL